MTIQQTTNYKIVEARSAHGLETFVKDLINSGWEPLGGASYNAHLDGSTRMLFVQTMIKQCAFE